MFYDAVTSRICFFKPVSFQGYTQMMFIVLCEQVITYVSSDAPSWWGEVNTQGQNILVATWNNNIKIVCSVYNDYGDIVIQCQCLM